MINAFDLFCVYHLGLQKNGKYKFMNINQTAGYFNVTIEHLNQLLKKHRMDSETLRHIPFNLAYAHTECQILSMDSPEDALEFARKAYEDFKKSLSHYSESKTFEDVDYDNIWDD